MSVQEIEAAIAQLPRSEVAELAAWLEDYRHQVWDKQIEDDLETGRLNSLIAEVESEFEAGLARPL